VPRNPFDLETAEYFVTMANEHGFKFVSNLAEYESRMRMGDVDKLTNDKKLLTSSGFTDFIQKLIKITTPMFSSICESFIPGSGQVITNLGNALTSSSVYRNRMLESGSSYSNRRPSEYTRYRSAGRASEQYVEKINNTFIQTQGKETMENPLLLEMPSVIGEWWKSPGFNASNTYVNHMGRFNVSQYYNTVAFPVVIMVELVPAWLYGQLIH